MTARNRSAVFLTRWRLLPVAVALAFFVIAGAASHLAEPGTVSGQVIGPAGPIAGARVRFKASPGFSFTDTEGRFTLRGSGRRITAWKEGFLIGGEMASSDEVRIRLRPFPTEDCPEYQWVDPRPDAKNAKNCGNCHGEIYREWAASGHRRASSNRRFLNIYDGTDWHGRAGHGWNLLQDQPDLGTVCSACHAPTVPFDHPGYEDIRQVEGVDSLGVHCDYCHKIQATSTKHLGLEHGRFAYSLLRPAHGQLFFGPLDDVDRDEDAYSPLYHQSRYCAACHEGTIAGVPVYTTYSEWRQSPAHRRGQQCQDCHMAPTGTMENIAPGRGGVRRDPATLASHRMRGADGDMLRSCLDLTIEVRHQNNTLAVVVEVGASNVGHRVPTGFIDRHLVLLVEARNREGESVKALSGPSVPRFAIGRSVRADVAGQLFARQLVGAQGEQPVPFWRPTRLGADTRLSPGQRVKSRWQFSTGPVRQLRIRLIYRRFYPAVAETKSWPDNEIPVWTHSIELPPESDVYRWRSPRAERPKG